jgi:hypothetical protein
MEKYGKFTILKEVDPFILPSGQKNRAFLCVCDCGKERIARLLHLKRNKIGCECSSKRGMKILTPHYHQVKKLWDSIKYRTSEKGIDKHIYFDRGIKVCDLWINSFASFYEWCIANGIKKGLVIDRVDNEKGYSPENCRFVTPRENALNKRDTFYYIDGDHKEPLLTLLRRKGLEGNYTAILNRIKRGYSHKEAVETPIRKGNYFRGKRK